MCVPTFALIERALTQLASQPFQGIKPGVYQGSDTNWLELVDGGLNLENVALGPLLVKARDVDVIVTIDASSDDSDDWPRYVPYRPHPIPNY